MGTSVEKDAVLVKSSTAMGLAFMVCKHSLSLEHVAI